jgi:tetratricopeptide (TPR) repeat protein
MTSDSEQLPIGEQLWVWFELNKTRVIGGAAAVAVVALVVGFLVWRSDEKANAAGEALSSVMLQSVTTQGGQPATADVFLKVAGQYPDSSAAERAILLAGGDYFVTGKYDNAKTTFERFTREHRGSPYMGQALLGIAACLDAQGKTNEAVIAYKELVDRRPGETIIPQAKFALARLYEAQGLPEKARPLFEDVWRDNQYSSLGSEAGMRLEELKIKFPSLAAAALPTNAVPYKVEKR